MFNEGAPREGGPHVLGGVEGGVVAHVQIPQEITINGVPIQLTKALASLQKKAIQNPKTSFGEDSKYVTALKNIQESSNNIEIITKELSELTFNSDGDIKGGRKTRRNRKHKKNGRKTKRKQRGGFHYSERAHRRRITTSSSSRRSSRRSSSRRSSRR